jgi:stage II sporulation protein D
MAAGAMVADAKQSGKQRPRRIGAIVGPIRLIPDGSEPLSVVGTHSYFGDLEISSAGDGLVLSDRLPLERYLLGLNEVPTSWPPEALEAQAIAARTYARYVLEQGPGGDAAVYGFDICATDQCQVFSGADVTQTLTGARWIDAVQSTAGETVLYRGKPILARYSSTSGGRTLNNEWAFPEEGPFPYLIGVESPDEQGSPLFRWSVEFKLDRLAKMLRSAGLWGEGPITDAGTVASNAGFHYPDVLVRGNVAGVQARFTAEEMRDALRDLAPQLYPKLYPSPAFTASGRLPETLPSNRIFMQTKNGATHVEGRGWGHAVGMSQWGAEGMALKGADHEEILTHYYTGVSVDSYPDPGSIEVGLGWQLRDISVSGAFSIVDGRGRTVVQHALGTWVFGWPGAGAVSVEPPQGFGLPLNIDILQAPRSVEPGEAVQITVALSRPARIATRATGGTQALVDRADGIEDAGRRRVVWVAPESGTFEVRVTADAGSARRRSEPVTIEVVQPALGRPPGSAAADQVGPGPFLWAALVALAALVAGGIFALFRRVSGGRQEPPGKLGP